MHDSRILFEGITISYERMFGYAKYFAAGIVAGYAFVKGVKAASNALYGRVNTTSTLNTRNTRSDILEEIIDTADRMHVLEALQARSLEHVCEHGDNNHPYIVENGVLIGLN